MTLRASELCYWIPKGRFPNPSGRLRRRGFRIDGSVWVIPNNAIPYHLLDEMTAAGVTWHLLEFIPGEGEKILALARNAMRKEIEDGQRRLAEVIERYDSRYDADLGQAQDGNETDKAEKQYRSRTKEAVKRAEQLLKDIEAAAARFGIEARSELPLMSALDRVNALRLTAGARASAYTRLAEQTKGTLMEAAASEDEVPAGELADYVEENGGNPGNVRELFAEPEPEHKPVMIAEPPKPAEATYRLVDRSASVEFTPQANGSVRVVRLWRGVVNSTKTVTKELARKEYNRLLDQGYTKF